MVPLKEILNHTNDKYRTTVAAQKVFQQIAENAGGVHPEDRREKVAVTCLRYVFLGRSEIIDVPEKTEKKDEG